MRRRRRRGAGSPSSQDAGASKSSGGDDDWEVVSPQAATTAHAADGRSPPRQAATATPQPEPPAVSRGGDGSPTPVAPGDDSAGGRDSPSRRQRVARPAREAEDPSPFAVLLPIAGLTLALSAVIVYLLLHSESAATSDHLPTYSDAVAAGGDDVDMADARLFGGRKVRDAQLRLRVDLADLYTGRTFEVEISRHEVCSRCQGSGADPSSGVQQCPHCHGRGVRVYLQRFGGFQQRVQATCDHCSGRGVVAEYACNQCHGQGSYDASHALEVAIEPGMAEGDAMRFRGKGNQVVDAAHGDVVLFVLQNPHPDFTRDGNDLRITLHVSLKEALLGFSRQVLHLDGRPFTVEADGVTEAGAVLVMPGLGMPVRGTNLYGNLHVTVQVAFPRYLTHDQRRLANDAFPVE